MNQLTTIQVQQTDIYEDAASFEHAQRVAKVFQRSVLVPEHLKKNDGADAVVAFGIARTMNEQPLVVMQNIYIVNGRASWSTKYKIARANRAGVFKGPIRWRSEGEGDGLKVTAYADLANVQGDTHVEAPVDMKMAKAEGWTKNPKYQSMPEHMLRWRSASMLIDLYCPDVMMGMPTVEEVETLPSVAPSTGVIDLSAGTEDAEFTDAAGPSISAPKVPTAPTKSADADTQKKETPNDEVAKPDQSQREQGAGADGDSAHNAAAPAQEKSEPKTQESAPAVADDSGFPGDKPPGVGV